MKKKITLHLDPWSQTALWLIVLLLAADRAKILFSVPMAHAQESGSSQVIDINLVQVGGSKINQETGIPDRQVGQPPTTRVGPGNFPIQKVEQ